MHHFGLIVVLVLLIAGLLLGAQTFVVLLASLTVAMVVVGVGLWICDRYSAGVRADRAARNGRIGEALSHYARLGIDQQTVQLLFTALPGWPDAQRALRVAFRELAALESLIDGARAVGVSSGLLDPLAREAENSAGVLQRIADRLGVAGAAGGNSPGIQDGLKRAIARIDRIAAALRAARDGLVELTLLGDAAADSGRDEAAWVRLRALGEAARELALLEERR